MTDEEKKAWEEHIAFCKDYLSRVEGVNVLNAPYIKQYRMDVWADAELTRLRSIVQRVEDVDTIAKIIFESEVDKTVQWTDNLGDWLRKNYLRHANVVRAYIRGEEK